MEARLMISLWHDVIMFVLIVVKSIIGMEPHVHHIVLEANTLMLPQILVNALWELFGMILFVFNAKVEESITKKKEYVCAPQGQDGMDLGVQPWKNVEMVRYGILLHLLVSVQMIVIRMMKINVLRELLVIMG